MLTEAMVFMKKAIKKEPEDPILREHHGDILLKLGKRAKAREQWLKSLQLDPGTRSSGRFRAEQFGDPDVLLKDLPPRKKEKK
jgi:predicted negative regulator of RcsB-dependent stress response